ASSYVTHTRTDAASCVQHHGGSEGLEASTSLALALPLDRSRLRGVQDKLQKDTPGVRERARRSAKPPPPAR
ncbi:unnamed protein product, partial [Ectocarpus sp. 4 AP-2014]